MNRIKAMYSDEIIKKHLPHDTARYGQIAAIRFALEAWDSGKKFVIIEAPTGSGKSCIGLTLAGFHNWSYYITIQKILQTQIINDYARVDMVELKGRNAYPCTFYDIHGEKLIKLRAIKQSTVERAKVNVPDCADGYCKKYLNKGRCSQCFPPRDASPDELEYFRMRYGVEASTCPYFEQVEKAMNAKKVLMNFSSFLYQTQYTPRFGERDLLIIDEAHQCEPQLMDFVSLQFSDAKLRDRGLKLPKYEVAEEYAIWFAENKIDNEIAWMIKIARERQDTKAEEEAVKLIHKYRRFMRCIADSNQEWTCEYNHYTNTAGPSYATVLFKPIFVSQFANELLFDKGERVLMMSATILDANVVAKSLNINKDDIAFFRMGNYFPVENRPIYIQGAAKMTGGKQNMSTWSKPLVKKVDEILGKYPNDKGIIHTHNFAIAELLLDRCKNFKRFTFQRNFKNKEEMLANHAAKDGSVIVAPAMHEGLDLRGELSRFQIIAKVPYPNFFDDKQLARRVEIDRKYLTWLVALKLVQSYGRSVRSDVDWAHTYIIDSAIDRFLQEADKMLPDWFKEAIIKCNTRKN